jgi:hypothetical protein
MPRNCGLCRVAMQGAASHLHRVCTVCACRCCFSVQCRHSHPTGSVTMKHHWSYACSYMDECCTRCADMFVISLRPTSSPTAFVLRRTCLSGCAVQQDGRQGGGRCDLWSLVRVCRSSPEHADDSSGTHQGMEVSQVSSCKHMGSCVSPLCATAAAVRDEGCDEDRGLPTVAHLLHHHC